MTTTNLEYILREWNEDSFRELNRHEEFRNGISTPFPLSPAERIFRLIGNAESHWGIAAGLDQFPEQLRHPESGESLAVGAVLDGDDATRGPDDDLKVLLAIGINFGQFDSFRNGWQILPDWSKTRMWRRLGPILKTLDEVCFHGEMERDYPGCTSERVDHSFLKPFHVVAVNFFPWVTQSNWREMDLNGISETVALRRWGYRDPAARIACLIERIANPNGGVGGGIGAIPLCLFHGAHSAVPYLGMETARQLKGKVRSNYVLCDDLFQPFKPANAVVLQKTVL